MLVDVHSGVYAGQRPNVGPSTLIMIYIVRTVGKRHLK